MTAQIIPFVRRPSLKEELRAAVAAFAAGSVTSSVPAAVVNAMRAPGVTTVTTTVHGTLRTVQIPGRPLTPAEIPVAWQRVLNSVAAPASLVVAS